MSTLRKRASILAIAGSLVLAVAAAFGSALGGSDPTLTAGCGVVEAGAIGESSKQTEYADRITQQALEPINPEQVDAVPPLAEVPASLDGLGIAWSDGSATGRFTTYYSEKAIGPTIAAEDFFAAGGIELVREPNDPGAGPYVMALKDQFGERVVVLKIGSFDAALTWADPMANGVRPHYLTWVDGKTNVTLIASRSVDDFVNIARSMVCGQA